jgi:gliding motility-associated-like protein
MANRIESQLFLSSIAKFTALYHPQLARMPKQIYFTFLFYFLLHLVLGQTPNECSYKPPREGETWCFYSNAKLEFHGGSLAYTSLPSSLAFGKGCSSISDKDGNLVFFSDGMKLWDKNSNLLSSALDGYPSCTQSALFVPHPAGGSRYILFTNHLIKTPGFVTKGLNYYTIDAGKIAPTDTLRPKKLLDECAEKLTATKHANGHDYWVVVHEWGNDVFGAYKITAAGVDSIPVRSSAGMVHTGSIMTKNPVGYMKLSPDGSRLAAAIFGSNKVEWFDFDNTTGKVSNARQIPSPDGGAAYGIEFSPDNTKLYFTTDLNPTTNANNNLYQSDLVTGGPPVLLNRLAHDITALQLAVDGKIYGTRYTQSYVCVIENPNRADTACNLKEEGLTLAGSTKMMGLPSFVQSFFDIPGITYDTKCDGDDTYFTLTNPANIDSIRWDFGDAASGGSNTDPSLKPFHKFSASGKYNVKTQEWFNGRVFDRALEVTINKRPPKSFAKDSLYILPRSSIELDAGAGMVTYLWQDGSAEQKLEVSTPGYYNVIIIDTNCCREMDTIKIVLLDLYVPNAFSPNKDGLNERFHVKGPTEGISDYRFYIYSRWGQLIWQTNSIEDSWDGTNQGRDCPVGTYSWVMKFGVTSTLTNSDKVEKRGILTLIK